MSYISLSYFPNSSFLLCCLKHRKLIQKVYFNNTAALRPNIRRFSYEEQYVPVLYSVYRTVCRYSMPNSINLKNVMSQSVFHIRIRYYLYGSGSGSDPTLFFVVWDYTCSYWYLLISSVQRLEPQIPTYL